MHHLNTKAVLYEKHQITIAMIMIVMIMKKDVEIVVFLKYLSKFWRTLDMPLINCEKNLIFIWSEKCVLTDIATQAVVPAQSGNKCSKRCNI